MADPADTLSPGSGQVSGHPEEVNPSPPPAFERGNPTKVWLLLVALLAVLAAVLVWLGGAGFAPTEAPVEQALQRLFLAQWEYHALDHDGDGYLEFTRDTELLGVETAAVAPGYLFRIHALRGEQYAPDGGLLMGFVISARPQDAAGTAYTVDRFGKLERLPAVALDRWLTEHRADVLAGEH